MGYNVYMGTHRAADIDWVTPVGSVAAGTATIDLAGLGLAEDTDYWFGLRAASDAGVEEEGTAAIVRARIHDGALVGPPPNAIHSASARATAGGKVTVDVLYSDVSEVAAATGIQVARWSDGAGAYDWDNLVQTISISGAGYTSTELDPTYTHGETVRLALRAVTAAGATGPVFALDPVVADAEAPGDVSVLLAEQAT